MTTVAVAMSGGVDSSVAAYLLLEQGYRVLGFSMRLHASRPDASSGCCSPEDFQDARLVAHRLGIPYYVLNFEEAFTRTVIDPFVASYVRGETPSPCVLCNTHVKFRHFLGRALAAGANLVATGHYARRSGSGPWQLRRGRDTGKDQSYFLFGITQEELARTLFPVGEMDKGEVRRIAADAGLLNADKPDSQEICFVENGRYAEFVSDHATALPPPGPIRDTAGREIGRHRGLHHYTVGQRRGLGLTSPLPMYVTAIAPEDNAIIVGSDEDLAGRRFSIAEASWIDGLPPAESFRATVQVRSRPVVVAADVSIAPGALATIELAEPIRALSPGQAAVFYDSDRVLGGGFITPPPTVG